MSTLLKLLVAAGLIALIASKVDLGLAANEVGRAGLLACLFVIAANLLQFVVLGWRWHMILVASGINIGFRAACRIVLVGTFFNQCLPTSLGGDAVRILALRQTNIPLKEATNSVLVDRLSGIAALVLLLLGGLPWLFAWAPATPMFFGACLVTAIFIAVLTVYFLGDRILALFPFLARFNATRVVSEASAYARRIAFGGPSSLTILALALLVALSTVGIVAGLAAILNAPLTLFQAVVLIPPIIAATMLPLSFGGWGTREVAMVAGLGIAGVAPATALAMSFLLGILLLISSLPGGFLWLIGRDQYGREKARTTGMPPA